MLKYGLPFRLDDWINDHRHLLKPPVGNQKVWSDADFIVTAVRGPKRRSEYHHDATREWFR